MNAGMMFDTGAACPPVPGIRVCRLRRRAGSLGATACLVTIMACTVRAAEVRVVGTGRTTGHIATLQVSNPAAEPAIIEIGPALIPPLARHQGYALPRGSRHVVEAGGRAEIPVHGYCTDIHRPPVPAGTIMPGLEEWITPGLPADPGTILIRPDGAYRPRPRPEAGQMHATFPGSERPLPFVIDVNHHVTEAAPYLLAALVAIEAATERLQQEGRISTPYSANREREKEAVVQQTFWLYTSHVQGEPYEQEQLEHQLESQYAAQTGQTETTLPAPVKETISQGADAFWDAFSLVGAEAKVLGTTPEQEGADAGTAAPPAEAAGCTPDERIEHTDPRVDIKVSEAYGNAEDREKIVQAVNDDVSGNGDTFSTDTPPATVYALWRHDSIGGIASAYAKTVFLQERGQDWVWSTEPLQAHASGSGSHTLSFSHGPECTAVVAGAAVLRMRATSEAFDPLERSIEAFRLLTIIKDISLELSLRRVPPGLSDAIEAGVGAVTDPASNTYATALGQATLQVGSVRAEGRSESRVEYRREAEEDRAINGGGSLVRELVAADVQPDSLTSTIRAQATLSAAASGNGHAAAHLESLYGTVIVGVCDCPNGIRFQALSDMGLLLRSRSAEGAARVARKDLQDLIDTLAVDITDGTIDTDGEGLKERITTDLREWAQHAGAGNFALPADPE